MILAMNGDNTSITMGLFEEEGDLVFSADLSWGTGRSKYELAVSIKSIFELHGFHTGQAEGIIISCAALSFTDLLIETVRVLWGRDPMIVGPGIKTGLNILIDDPAQLGADLVATSVAAAAKYSKPIVIIRLSTAIVMSVINAKGQHIGGIIAPGMDISFEELSRRGAQLPRILIQRPERVIGSDTIAAMQSGIFYGAVSMIEGMIRRVEHELKEKCTVVITGNRGEEICSSVKQSAIFDSSLLLDGLYLLYKKNSRQ